MTGSGFHAARRGYSNFAAVIVLNVPLLLAALPAPQLLAGDASIIHFDLPPVAVATPVSADETRAADQKGERETAPLASGYETVQVELNLSSMIATPDVPRIDQWLVRCVARDASLSVVDYWPRTEVASELGGPIAVKKTNEQSDSLGISLDAVYGHLGTGRAGADHGRKKVESLSYERIAPVHAVTAAGTIHRGRGAYFKLRWTTQQVLEGEKVFRLTFRVPQQWRGGLIDVSVVAQTEHQSFAGLDSEIRTLGSANYVVATYRAGDVFAKEHAEQLAIAEQKMRRLAIQHQQQTAIRSLPSLIHHVAKKLDGKSTTAGTVWMEQLIAGHADPYIDKQISKLPMDVRIAALDYYDARNRFTSIGETEETSPLQQPSLAASHPKTLASADDR